jgi:hypothetical protein
MSPLAPLTPFRTIRIGRHPTKKEQREILACRNLLSAVSAPQVWWLQAVWLHRLPEGLQFMASLGITYRGLFCPKYFYPQRGDGLGGSRISVRYGWAVGWTGSASPEPDLSMVSNMLVGQADKALFLNAFPRPQLALLVKPLARSIPHSVYLDDESPLTLAERLQNLKYAF